MKPSLDDIWGIERETPHLVERMKILTRMYLKACANSCGENIEWSGSPQASHISPLRARSRTDQTVLGKKSTSGGDTVDVWKYMVYGVCRLRLHSETSL